MVWSNTLCLPPNPIPPPIWKNLTCPTINLMVVGAGRGPLVRASLQAAERTGRKLKVHVVVEKNPNAVVTHQLQSLVKLEGWKNLVIIISCNIRCSRKRRHFGMHICQ